MFEDLSYDELRRRANAPLPARLAARIETHGERRSVEAGEFMYRSDDRHYPFVYAVSATLRIRDPTGMVLGDMGPGQFTGDLALLLGQTAFADCVVIEAGEVVVIPQAEIMELVQVDPEVSDLLLQAFAARRLMQIQRRQGTLMLIGSQDAPALRRVLVYAERNRIPYRWIDPTDPAQRSDIPPAAAGGDGAKVVVRARHVLTDPSVADVARALGLDLTVSDRDRRT
ncbi:MAG TPA: Crp/Fnr family transcriptional regulator [Caulobacteraceae bacterium]|nr:Crp/Fnr family transcriptional regulator [Caulobacteraceae bacterium]